MLHYRDRTFCSRIECMNTGCQIRFTAEDKMDSERVGLPIAFSDYKDKDNCPGYKGDIDEQKNIRNNTTR